VRILVVGSSGREHALVWKLLKSPIAPSVYCAPGNGGISGIVPCPAIAECDTLNIVDFCLKQQIDIVVVGGAEPLSLGLTDQLKASNIFAIGPSRIHANLEASKAHMKQLCDKLFIPTPKYKVFEEKEVAFDFVRSLSYFPIVIKADGLAGGKGVKICRCLQDANDWIEEVFENHNRVIVEEFIEGKEVSFFVFTDGVSTRLFENARDYKSLDNNDTGPNTGGMGCFSPTGLGSQMQNEIYTKLVEPILKFYRKQNQPYVGFLYAGVIISKAGPLLIEINVRLGDAETQVLLPRLESDLLGMFIAAKNSKLSEFTELVWKTECALCVCMATAGYPDDYSVGHHPLDFSQRVQNVLVFHGATRREKEKYFCSGGRVLHVVALTESLSMSREIAYSAVESLAWPGSKFRSDIGL
jgi:phosphoribosylamine--glycine ligase